MQCINRMAPAIALVLVSACASTARMPVTDVPAGTYVMVEPASGEYNAVTINEGAFAARMGNQTLTGKHWVDRDGVLHMTADTGVCANQESLWTYSYANNRITLDLVEDRCTARSPAFPDRMVYQRN